MIELSPGMRRLAAVALLAGAMLLLWTMIAAPALEAYAEARETAARLGAALARIEGGGEDVGALQKQLAELKRRRRSTAGLLEGANESIVAAQLQNRVKNIVEAAKGELKSAQILPGRDEGKFRRVTLRGQVQLGIPALQRVLYELEAATPYLFIEAVDVKARPLPRARAAQEPLLDMRFDISGYMRQPT